MFIAIVLKIPPTWMVNWVHAVTKMMVRIYWERQCKFTCTVRSCWCGGLLAYLARFKTMLKSQVWVCQHLHHDK